jgi:hypothetical protein
MLYVGGGFATIAGQSRPKLASFDLATGALTSWTAAIDASSLGVTALAITGGTAYASGYFGIGSRPPSYAGSFDATTGAEAAWYPWWFSAASRFVVAGASLIAVGAMHHIAGYPRQGIAIFDL